MLRDGERLEDLQYKGLRIIQSSAGFRFGTDSILLAGFVKAKPHEKAVDLGSGTGVIAMLVSARTCAGFTAVEIQPEQCDMARRSIELNGLDIPVIEADMRTAHEILGRGKFDLAVVNPPYYPASGGTVSKKGGGEFAGAATHDLFCTMDEVAGSAARLIKYGGKLFICCPAARLAELFRALAEEKLEPKRLRFVAARGDKAPYLALIEAKKGAAPGIRMEKQLVITNEDGTYTDEVRAIYHIDDE